MLFGQKENSNGLKRKVHISKRELRNRMNNWKIISKIAVIFSIVFIVFAVVSAIINYQSLIIQYSMVPTNFIDSQYFICDATIHLIRCALICSRRDWFTCRERKSRKRNLTPNTRAHNRQRSLIFPTYSSAFCFLISFLTRAWLTTHETISLSESGLLRIRTPMLWYA